jgi:hypothetical protein
MVVVPTPDLSLGADMVFSGTVPASTAKPWVKADFYNYANYVLLQISAPHLSSSEYLDILALNVADKYANSLSLTVNSNDYKVGTFANPTWTTGKDGYKADGDGKYDVKINFDNAQASRFNGGELVSIRITSSVSGLTANDFNCLSTPAPDSTHGPFRMAAHLNALPNVNDVTSGWAAPVPEPSAVILLGIAVFTALAIFRTKR